jgi:beta-galactosidase
MKPNLKSAIIISSLLIFTACQLQPEREKVRVESSVVPEAIRNEVVFPDYHIYGVSYYPEQTPENEWEDDFRKMAELGFNTVRMGEFAWAIFEPAEGQYHFEWMDKAIDLAAKYHIKTILSTPTANVTPWLRKKYPEVLGANSIGDYTYGARKGYNVNSAKYIRASEKITEAMARHYGDNPNIIGWQLDNESGYPFELYDDVSLSVFQDWLKARYGTLDNLNKVWNGAFWSLNYSDWNQIEFATNRGDGSWHPEERMDYRRFFSYSFQNHLAKQVNILRQYIGNRFIYTNWPNTYWSVDVFETASKMLDATSWDNYSPMPGLTDHKKQYESALHDDISRNAGPGQRFFIAERPAQVAAHIPVNSFRTHFYKDLAHGSMGSIFFEWKPPVGGQEYGYRSVLQMDGSLGPAVEIYIQMGKELKKIGPELLDAKTESDIAVIYSYQNQWEKGFWLHSSCWEKGIWQNTKGYDTEAEMYYTGLKILNRNIDAISEYKDLSPYKLVVAPGLRMVSDETGGKLEKWVAGGGILVLDKNAGTRDTLNRYRQLIPPGVFRKMAGIRIEQSSSKSSMSGNLIMGADNQMHDVAFGVKFLHTGAVFEPETTIEELILEGAIPIATAYGGELTGKCAISINRYGNGYVIYVGTDSKNAAFYESLGKYIREKFDIKPLLPVPYGCEVVSRVKAGKEYIFVLNYTLKEQSFVLPMEMQEMLSGETLTGNTTIAPLDVKIFIRKITE